ncbi:hypothetical protein QJS04_geneDACA005260 [Acorus gramineus]|uniref:C2H2-type domain-containing protein n=1 Tax=Acorus gramineus TaxID=55184 RepID=A0AAV9AYJ9_ACOGR|nr:hypothetical protein QJS04_geneDACA005260 [Acorus gramineus]
MHASMSETPNLKSHKCPYCPRTFKSLQSFGGHQTAHRREIEEMRRQAEKAPSSSAAAMHVQQNRRALDLISRVGLGEVGVARALQEEEEEEEHVHVEVKREGLEELDLISKVGLGK